MSGWSRSLWHSRPYRCRAVVLLLAALQSGRALAGEPDPRIRERLWAPDQVYRLEGRAGYQIDVEFEPGESFAGLSSGDLEGIAFMAQDNHLFLKPKAARVHTNLVVLTNRRRYYFDYESTAVRPESDGHEPLYVLRFGYPPPPPTTLARATQPVPVPDRPTLNLDYWYCGDRVLRPLAASDDGVRTRLRFAPARELPAIFLRNADGSESLLNFSAEQGELVVHRVAPELILRRGRLVGRITNPGFQGTGERLDSGTLSPEVERVLREVHP